jgi:hypothetical protein
MHDASEVEAFVFVQVVRFQADNQADRLSLHRNAGWVRKAHDACCLPIIDDQPLRNLEVSQFISLHEELSPESPNDDSIRIRKGLWHAQPSGGIYSSLEIGRAVASKALRGVANNVKTTTSNRLLKFKPNAGGDLGVPFKVKINGTDAIIIRTYSPNRSDFDRIVNIVLKR